MKPLTHKDQTASPSSEAGRQGAARPVPEDPTKARQPDTPARHDDRVSESRDRDDELADDEDVDDDDQFEDDEAGDVADEDTQEA